jgi:hypothetical protein
VDSSGYGLDYRGIVVQFPTRKEIFLFSKSRGPDLGQIQLLIQWSSRVKRLGREADYLPQSSTSLGMGGFIAPLPYTLMTCTALTLFFILFYRGVVAITAGFWFGVPGLISRCVDCIWWDFSWFYSYTPGKCRHSALNCASMACCHVVFNSLFTKHHTAQHYFEHKLSLNKQ